MEWWAVISIGCAILSPILLLVGQSFVERKKKQSQIEKDQAIVATKQEAHQKWIDEHKNDHKDLIKEHKQEHKQFIDEIVKVVNNKNVYSRYSSPINLTKKGERLVLKSGILQYAEGNIQKYRDDLMSKEREVEIWDECVKIAELFFQEASEDAQDIRQHFYDKGIEEAIMKELFAIQLRNEYLKIRNTKKVKAQK